MTRINLVPTEELADQHLVAEYRELFMVGSSLQRSLRSPRWNINKKGEILNTDMPTTNFAQLLELVALVAKDLRVRFSTSHPKDMTDEVLETMQ